MKQTIHFKNTTRFTVMADNLIRLEYSETGEFLDKPTLAVAERQCTETEFSVKEDGATLHIETRELKLTYTDTGEGFTESNLTIQYASEGTTGTWTYGSEDPQVLPGTLRTLDNMDGDAELYEEKVDGKKVTKSKKVPFIPGYVSRSGYTFFDDSKTIPLTAENEKGEPWVAPRREGKIQDGYFATYGHDYYRALRTMSQFIGKQPIPPRFAFGLWFSRFWEFTDKDLETIVETHDNFNIPFDVMVIDMDWHKLGWTGYSWDPTFFPNPSDTLAYLDSKGIKITMNLHPADGVAKHEDQYEAMCAEMGVDPASGESVPFAPTDPKFMEAYFRLLHHPFEDQGVRFWWMDWQQGQTSAIEGLDPLPWLNELHWRDLATRFPDRRPMIFSRFGGPGAGRTPIGFSGDTNITWATLAFQPYFTATSANIGFGYWSHDIGGHFFGDNTDKELFTRWVQFGAYSPIFRLHECKNPGDHRVLWNFKRPYQEVLIETARQRYRMLPYITSELNHCWAQDTSLCMPMYYSYPEVDDAYQAKDQYFFGRQMFVAPVTSPVDPASDLASKKIWIPEGEWIDYANGLTHKGPKWIEESYLLEQTPVFVQPGAIWVEQTVKPRAGTGSYEDLQIIAVGETDGDYLWTEDDGDSLGYQNGDVARIRIRQKTTNGCSTFTIGKEGNGSFESFKKTRKVALRLPFRAVPESVAINGSPVGQDKRGTQAGWRFDGDRLELIVELGLIDLTAGCEVVIHTAKANLSVDTANYVYRQSRLLHAWSIAQAGAIGHHLTPYQRSLPWLAQTGRRLSHFPEQYAEQLEDFASKWKTLEAEFREFCELLSKEGDYFKSRLEKNLLALATLEQTN